MSGFWRSGRSGGAGKQDPSDYLLRKLWHVILETSHPEGAVRAGPIYWMSSGLARRYGTCLNAPASLCRFCSASRGLYEARVPLTFSLEVVEGMASHHMACKYEYSAHDPYGSRARIADALSTSRRLGLLHQADVGKKKKKKKLAYRGRAKNTSPSAAGRMFI